MFGFSIVCCRARFAAVCVQNTKCRSIGRRCRCRRYHRRLRTKCCSRRCRSYGAPPSRRVVVGLSSVILNTRFFFFFPIYTSSYSSVFFFFLRYFILSYNFIVILRKYERILSLRDNEHTLLVYLRGNFHIEFASTAYTWNTNCVNFANTRFTAPERANEDELTGSNGKKKALIITIIKFKVNILLTFINVRRVSTILNEILCIRSCLRSN